MNNSKNVQEWIKLIEVDWLGQYAKAWIAFNAWYRKQPFGIGGDRKIIQGIKDNKNGICSTIERLFMDTGTDSKAFQSNVAELQSLLSFTGIESKGRKISFEAITDYKHVQNIKEVVRKTTYEIKVDLQETKRNIEVRNSLDEIIFSGEIKLNDESLDPNEKWFKSVFAQNIQSLSGSEQETLIAFLKESSPIHNLLTGTENDCIKIENFRFINNQNLIVRAIIEVLYQLRNSLFHGEITPTPEIQKTYEPAYLILKRIILLIAIQSTDKSK